MRSDNKYTLITGATSGIGSSMAVVFAKNDYNLILTGRNEEKLKITKEELSKKYNIDVHIFTKNLGSMNGARELYNEIMEKELIVDI